MEPEIQPARSLRALIFRLGGRVLATVTVPGGRIVEVAAWTRVPTAPPHLLGLANVRGKVLAVVDVRPLLGLPETPWGLPLQAVAVGGDALRVAVAVEEVLGFEPFDPRLVEPLDAEEPKGFEIFGRGVLDLAAWRPTLVDLPAAVETLRVRRPGALEPAPDRPAPGAGDPLPTQPEEDSRWMLH